MKIFVELDDESKTEFPDHVVKQLIKFDCTVKQVINLVKRGRKIIKNDVKKRKVK